MTFTVGNLVVFLMLRNVKKNLCDEIQGVSKELIREHIVTEIQRQTKIERYQVEESIALFNHWTKHFEEEEHWIEFDSIMESYLTLKQVYQDEPEKCYQLLAETIVALNFFIKANQLK